MTLRADGPAQTAERAGERRKPTSPASPSPSVDPVAAGRASGPARSAKPTDPAIHCGRQTNEKFNGGKPCRQRAGFRTEHPGVGACWLHGGNTPVGKKHAAREAAERAIAKLGRPVSGDPISALQEAVDAARGLYVGAEAMLREQVAQEQLDLGRLEVWLKVYGEAIDRLAKVAKAAVEANVAERKARVDEAMAEVIERLLGLGLDAAGVTGEKRRAAFDRIRDEAALLAAAPPSGFELS